MSIAKKTTLCWKCRKATNPKGSNCEWAGKFQPVKGWEAIPTRLKAKGKGYISSYQVVKCPKFEADNKGRLDNGY